MISAFTVDDGVEEDGLDGVVTGEGGVGVAAEGDAGVGGLEPIKVTVTLYLCYEEAISPTILILKVPAGADEVTII